MRKHEDVMERDMDHETVVEDWQQNAERHDEENYEFLRSMKFRDNIGDLDVSLA